MAKFLYSTDHHFHHIGPVKRIDDFPQSLLEKLEETVQLSNDLSCDAMLFGGDFFNNTSPGPKIIKQIIQVLRGAKAPIWAIMGNHDVPGNLEASEDKILGLLREFDDFPINYIDESRPVIIDNVTIEGIPFYRGIEKALLAHNKQPEPNRVLMAHAFIADKPCMFDYCFYGDLKLSAVAILTSHYHTSFGVKENGNGNVFVSPGGFSRLTVQDVNRTPQVSVVEIDGYTCKVDMLPLTTAKPVEEIFDLNELRAKSEAEDSLKLFVDKISNVELAFVDIPSLIDRLSKESKLPKEVREVALTKYYQVLSSDGC